jgi:drug/metabolite transporter (DMT)-like permease
MSGRSWAALAIVYVVWGSTYLAIRVAIETLPPFLMAGVRFLVAGGVLYAWALLNGDVARERPGRAAWRAAAIVGAGLFLGGNGGVVWAETRIASGVAALLVCTLSLWMSLLAWLLYGERPPRVAAIGLPLGFAGTALLVGPVDASGIDPLGALVCVGASISWAAASLYSRHAPLPRSTLLATGMQMLAGGAWMLAAGLVHGEVVRPSAFSAASVASLLYLIVLGSLVAFTAYAWLLRNAPIPIVATYGYVNPVVAVALGWLVLGEPVTPRMVVAGTVILAAVAMMTRGARAQPAVARDRVAA